MILSLVTVVIERASNHIASMFGKKLLKVSIDVKAINVGRCKTGTLNWYDDELVIVSIKEQILNEMIIIVVMLVFSD